MSLSQIKRIIYYLFLTSLFLGSFSALSEGRNNIETLIREQNLPIPEFDVSSEYLKSE
ncbi:MAG: hypothetical protein H6626_10270 [Pseudobdellovibrionaceae bacterium]|nr:MAG: hypothetical protein H6626_10270 [Pseudobdellovibrionaceae bacterium]